MNRLGVRIEDYWPATAPEASTPVHVFAVHEEVFVQQAYLLQRCAYDAFAWEDAAVERALRFLYVTYGLRAQDTWNDATQSDDPACCDGASDRTLVDDTWVPHIVSAVRRPSFLEPNVLVYGGRPGKNCGFADWWTLGLKSLD